MKRHIKLLSVLGCMATAVGCSNWPENGTGGIAEVYFENAYPVETNADLTFHHGLRSDFEIQKNKLDILVINGARQCFPASVATALERENRIIRTLIGGLLDDSAIDLINQRDHLAELDRKLEAAVAGGSCKIKHDDNRWHKNNLRLETVNKIINNHNIFALGSYEINPAYAETLAHAADMLSKQEHYFLHIKGHTDNDGDESSNINLSKQRAEKVAAFLIKNGVDKESIKTYAYGEYLNRYDGEEDHINLANRRVHTVVKPSQLEF